MKSLKSEPTAKKNSMTDNARKTQKNTRGESNESPEISDRKETSDIPDLLSGKRVRERGKETKQTQREMET